MTFHPNDKKLIWDRRLNLKGTKMFVTEDYEPEVMEIRRRLTPIAIEAKRQGLRPSYVEKGTLVVMGKMYTTETLDELPKSLKDITMSCSQNDSMLAFFRKHNPLSNHSHAPFDLEDMSYNCSEQYFLSTKCQTYGHTEAANRIMKETNPATMVQIAKICQGYNRKWEKTRYDVMLKGCEAKFDQNWEHQKYLLETGEKTLVEGSRFDTTWGVGLDFTDRRIFDEANWKGRNLLGTVLEQVRTRHNNLEY